MPIKNARIAAIHLLVERQTNATAKHVQSHVEKIRFLGSTESRHVEVFSLENHPTGVTRAYAWEKLGDGTNKVPEITIVLKAHGINSAQDALQWFADSIVKSL
jgi:hypothetical protein